MPIRTRLTSDYIAAALPLGLQVRRCEEPRRPFPLVDDGDLRSATGDVFPAHVPGAPPNIWRCIAGVPPRPTSRIATTPPS